MRRIDELNKQWLQEEQKKVSAPETTLQIESRKSSEQKPPLWKDLLFLLIKIILIALVSVLVLTFLFGIIRYQEPSMAPAIKDGDIVIFYHYNNVGYLPRDVIVLKYNGRRQARRVVATAGDTVDITDDGLVINGALQQESEICQKTERYQDGVSFPLTVPEGQIFVLSDSRTGATDSRIYGCVKLEETLGKVTAVIRRRSI
jgi:signal peptidase I